MTTAARAEGRGALDADLVARFHEQGWWGTTSVSDLVAGHAASTPTRVAYAGPDDTVTWAEYDRRATALAVGLAERGISAGDPVAILLPDSPMVHVCYLGVERAGGVVVGIGPRSGPGEVRHLLDSTRAVALISPAVHRGEDLVAAFDAWRRDIPSLREHLVVGLGGGASVKSLLAVTPTPSAIESLRGRAAGPDALHLINSTSGTTGLPKCVEHNQNRWLRFSQLAIEAGELSGDDRVMSVVPSPYGFGLWTAHFCPTALGATTVLLGAWDAETAIETIARERITVLAAVTTQLMMMLDSPSFETADLSSLRVVFTGGEAVPYARAKQFEDRAGCAVLQFYGSNETGALSHTSLADDQEHRLRTAGRTIPEMSVRVLGPDGAELDERPARGQPICRGPLLSLGYHRDPGATAELVRDDGWFLMPDIVEVDAEGYLSVVGRVADIIIRGGMNISAVEVEQAVVTHPDVRMAAAVGVPDPTFGERVCAFVTVGPGRALDVEGLRAHLQAAGVATHLWPERIEVLDEMPLSSGGKVAKSALRDRVTS